MTGDGDPVSAVGRCPRPPELGAEAVAGDARRARDHHPAAACAHEQLVAGRDLLQDVVADVDEHVLVGAERLVLSDHGAGRARRGAGAHGDRVPDAREDGQGVVRGSARGWRC